MVQKCIPGKVLQLMVGTVLFARQMLLLIASSNATTLPIKRRVGISSMNSKPGDDRKLDASVKYPRCKGTISEFRQPNV
jgi:hypothetical protein